MHTSKIKWTFIHKHIDQQIHYSVTVEIKVLGTSYKINKDFTTTLFHLYYKETMSAL